MSAQKTDERPTVGCLEEIEFKEGRYFSQIWNVGGRGKDWLGAVWKDPDGPWTLTYRFRYYLDDKAHDSADERSWYEMQVPASEPEERVLRAMNKIAEMTRIEYGGAENANRFGCRSHISHVSSLIFHAAFATAS